MSWVLLTVGSYFFSALSQTVDKVLLRARIPSAATYAFYSGITSVFVVILLPFLGRLTDLFLPPTIIALSLFVGIIFVAAIYFLYFSLKRCDVSRIVPFIGGGIPVFLLIFSYLFWGGTFYLRGFISIVLFIAGGLVLTTEIRQKGSPDSLVGHLVGSGGYRFQICQFDARHGILAALCAAFFFALTFFLTKEVFLSSPGFIPEFFWIRMGSALGALLMLIIPRFRAKIFLTSPYISRSSFGMLFGNKIIGATSFILLNYAFYVAPSQTHVVIINALKGAEHLFVFIFSVGLSLFVPHILREDIDRHTLILKSTGILLIVTGFWFLQ